MKLPDPGSLHSRRDLQRTFAFSDSRHVGEVSKPDFRLQRRSDPVLALQKKGRVRFAPETVRCVIKLQSQVHHTSLQLRRHFLFTERGDSPRSASTSGGVPGHSTSPQVPAAIDGHLSASQPVRQRNQILPGLNVRGSQR